MHSPCNDSVFRSVIRSPRSPARLSSGNNPTTYLARVRGPNGKYAAYTVTVVGGRHTCPVAGCTLFYSRKHALFEHMTTHDSSQSGNGSGLDVLIRLGCSYNVLHSLVICDSCGRALEPTNLNHVDRHHSRWVSDLDVVTVLGDLNPVGAKGFALGLDGPVEAIPGIPIMVNGIYCPFRGCDKAFKDKRGLRKHYSKDHQCTLPVQPFTFGPYQSVFGKAAGNTRVTLKVSEEESHLRTAAYLDSLPKPPQYQFGSLHPANLTPFLRATQWHVFMENLSKGTPPIGPKQFGALAHRDRRGLSPEQVRFKEQLREYCEETAQRCKGTVSLALQMVNTKKGTVVDQPFSPPQEKVTRDTYSDVLFDFLNFVMDTLPGSDGFSCSLSPGELSLAQTLRGHVYGGGGEGSTEAAFAFLYAAMSNDRGKVCEKFQDPFVQFLIGSSLQVDGSFRQPREITRTVAALQYCFRLFLLKFCIDTSKREEKDLLEVLKVERIHITEAERFNSFHALQDVMHIGSAHADDSQALPSVVWLAEEKLNLFGKDVNLDAIRGSAKRSLERARSILVDDLMKGMTPEEFFPEYSFIPDDFSNSRAGYSFLTDPSGPFFKVRNELAKRLLNHDLWGKAFARLDEDGKLAWVEQTVLHWLGMTDKFRDELFFLLHTTSGLPPRGTEASETLYSNTLTARRNVFALGMDLVTIHNYNKTTRNRGNRDRPIPRKLCRPVADLLIAYLALVRPLEEVLVNVVERKKETLVWYGSHLWACRGVKGGKWDTRHFNEIFKKSFVGVEFDMTIGTWRHLCIAIVRRHILKQLDGQPDIKKEVVEALTEEQMGHSPETGALSYAVEDKGLQALTERKLKMFMLASDLYQSILHLKEMNRDEVRELMGLDSTASVGRLPKAFLCDFGEGEEGTSNGNLEEVLAKAAPAIASALASTLEGKVGGLVEGALAKGVGGMVDAAVSALESKVGGLVEAAMKEAGDRLTRRMGEAVREAVREAVESMGEKPESITIGKRKGEDWDVSDVGRKVRRTMEGEVFWPSPQGEVLSSTSWTQPTKGLVHNPPSSERRGSPEAPREKPREVDPLLVLRLREIMGDAKATWYSREQAQAVQNIVHNQNQHTLTIIRTGGGKTLLYAIAGSLSRLEGVYVVVVPNRALLEDLKTRMVDYKVECTEWRTTTNDTFQEREIVFVSADVACHALFLERLRGMASRGVLKGIFMDEAHKWVTEAHFRFKLQNPKLLVSLGVPMHLCTATLRPGMEQRLTSELGLDAKGFAITRGSVDRHNLKYKVVRCPETPGRRNGEVLPRLLQEVKRVTASMNPGELGLIICRSVETAREVATKLGCGYFHADRTGLQNDSRQHYTDWQKQRTLSGAPTTKERWLSCTPLIDTGNDTRGVRYTFFMEAPFDMISLQQGAGRTGREGQDGEVSVFFDTYNRGGLDPDLDEDFVDVRGIKLYVENETECRRLMITRGWDTVGVSCGSVPRSIPCDICTMKQQGVVPFVPRPIPGLRTVEEGRGELRKRMDEEKSNHQILLLVHSNLITSGFCPFHLAIKGEETIHPPGECTLTTAHAWCERSNSHAEGSVVSGFSMFSNEITWQKGFVCFLCFFPHQGKIQGFHDKHIWTSCKTKAVCLPGGTSSGTFAQYSKRFISAILWSLFCSKEVQVLISGSEKIPECKIEFCKYITSHVQGSQYPMALALVARILKDRVAKHQVSDIQ